MDNEILFLNIDKDMKLKILLTKNIVLYKYFEAV